MPKKRWTKEELLQKKKELEERIKEITAQELLILRRIKEFREKHGSKFFKPFDYQQKVVDLLHQGKKIVVFQGANRIGKTLLGACLVDSFARGIQEWDGKTSIFGGKPTRGRILVSNWETHAVQVIIPKLKEVIPYGTYQTKKNNLGVEYLWYFPKNGSIIEIVTHSQETKVIEGWTGHWVWADEPFPRDKYVALRRGLVTTGGVFLITMTALDEPWILDEIVLSNRPEIGCVTGIPMSANKTITEHDIESFKRDLTEDEIKVRVEGGWLQLTGLILKEFDPSVHIIEPFEVPPDWPVTAMIDCHLAIEQAIGFYAVDPNGIHYVIDEIWEHLSPKEIADAIIRKKAENHWNLREAFIDPLSKGDTAYLRTKIGLVEDTFTQISKALREFGIKLEVASKDKDSGIRNLKSWLRGPNKMPTLYFFRTCERHLWEIRRWKYDKDGKPMKENDHFMENLYRYTLTGVKYRKPVRLSYEPSGGGTRESIYHRGFGSDTGWMGV